ncbi:MAG: hypothetical protein FWG66_05775 [Spirochaetes bacterium]|nr:hypothetical protein [Spirochaetota bacterium]
MAKKTIFFFVAAAFAVAGASAQVPLSFGIGSSLISDFGGGVSGSVNSVAAAPDVIPNDNAFRLGHELYSHTRYVGRATSVFFDAHFVQFTLSYFTSSATHSTRSSPGENATATTNFAGSGGSPNGLEFGLFGKFPIELSPAITVFPLGGVVYRLVLGGAPALPPHTPAAANISTNPIHLSAPWFRLGGGMDLNITEGMFLRTTLTYGIRLRNRFENDILDSDPFQHGNSGTTPGTGTPPDTDFDHRWTANYDSARLGHGVDVTVGLGFRLR